MNSVWDEKSKSFGICWLINWKSMNRFDNHPNINDRHMITCPTICNHLYITIYIDMFIYVDMLEAFYIYMHIDLKNTNNIYIYIRL